MAMSDNKNTTALQSDDDLEKSLHATVPSMWIALGAFAALLAGLLVWGIFGSVATTVHVKTVVLDGVAICILTEQEAELTHEGDDVLIRDTHLEVGHVLSIPVSRDEVEQDVFLDYLADALLKDGWGYTVTFKGDISELPESVPLDTTITVDRTAPIKLLLGG